MGFLHVTCHGDTCLWSRAHSIPFSVSRMVFLVFSVVIFVTGPKETKIRNPEMEQECPGHGNGVQ